MAGVPGAVPPVLGLSWMYLECGAGYKKIVEQDTKRWPLFVKSQPPNGNPQPPKKRLTGQTLSHFIHLMHISKCRGRFQQYYIKKNSLNVRQYTSESQI